jgi:O-methyltransferase domain
MTSAAAVARLRSMIFGPWVAASLHTVAELRIADLLAREPRSAEELATAAGVRPDLLQRVLRMLVAHGVFAERADGHFEQNELSGLLREDATGSLRPSALLHGSSARWVLWPQMLHTLRTGETAFSKVHGMEVFDYLASHEDDARLFNSMMSQSSATLAAEIVAGYDFGRFQTIVDVGGGHGFLIASLLEAVPKARGVLFDLPEVIEGAHAALAARGLADRCALVGGSFFDAVPPGGDGYIMKWILHDWDDAACDRVLRNIRSVIPPSGRLVVVDRLLPERVTDDVSVRVHLLADLTMLMTHKGRERTEKEFRKAFEQTGFALASVRTTATGYGILEGVPT